MIEHESLINTATVDSITIYWSLDGNVPFNIETMAAVDADTYSGSIPAQGNNTEVHYFVFAMAENGFFPTSPPGAPLKAHAYVSSDTVLAIPEITNLPRSYTLRQNYPNPFNPTTVVEYSLLEAIEVRLDIYDLRGQLVKRLVYENQIAGEYAVTIDATGLPSGIYFYRLQTTDFYQTKKMLILK